MSQTTKHKFHIPSSRPYFPADDRRIISTCIEEILASGRITNGPWTEKFENSFKNITGSKYAVATNSGTSALEILLRFFQVQGGEVILPTNTFLASSNAVIFAGGKPVLTDISPENLCINLTEIDKHKNAKTRGVIVVHIAGLVCPEIDAIREYCKTHHLFLIEDAAHSPGAATGERMAGNLADGAAFSFYPTKPVTTGEGGMITTDDEKCEKFARSVRCHGIAVNDEARGKTRNLLVRLGYNWRMSEIQAVIGFYQLQKLNVILEQRNKIASWYREGLQQSTHVKFQVKPDSYRHSYYKFPVLLSSNYSGETVRKKMKEEFGIECGSIYYPPCHLQPVYMQMFGYRRGDLPVAEDVLERTIALPVYPGLQKNQAEEIISGLIQILSGL